MITDVCNHTNTIDHVLHVIWVLHVLFKLVVSHMYTYLSHGPNTAAKRFSARKPLAVKLFLELRSSLRKQKTVPPKWVSPTKCENLWGFHQHLRRIAHWIIDLPAGKQKNAAKKRMLKDSSFLEKCSKKWTNAVLSRWEHLKKLKKKGPSKKLPRKAKKLIRKVKKLTKKAKKWQKSL